MVVNTAGNNDTARLRSIREKESKKKLGSTVMQPRDRGGRGGRGETPSHGDVTLLHHDSLREENERRLFKWYFLEEFFAQSTVRYFIYRASGNFK